jgi:hypothetical protein
MNALNAEFASYLAAKYVPKTVRKHTSIVDMFIEFICGHTDVEQLEEITRGMVNRVVFSICRSFVSKGDKMLKKRLSVL